MTLGDEQERPREGGGVQAYSMPALVEIPASASLADVVFSRARAEPDAVVLRRRAPGFGWQDVTAAGLRAEAAGLARGLIAAGIAPGDRVALMSRTRYEWTLIDYAIWAAGGVTVPIYETSSAEQAAWILRDSGASAVFTETSRHADIIGSIRAGLPALEHLWVIDGIDALASDGTSISDDRLDQRRAARTARDLATVMYTSGTTGPTKGCELTHGNLLAVARNAISALPEIFDAPDPSTLLFLPLAHVFARIIQIACLEGGAVLGHWPDTATVADGLSEFRPTFLLAVPRVFEKVYESARRQAMTSGVKARLFTSATQTAIAWSRACDGGRAGREAGPALRLRHALLDRLVYGRLRGAVGGRVRYAISGGAPLGERLGHFFSGAGITVLEGYGLSEATAGVTLNRPGRNRIGTVGPPLPGVSVKIAADGVILVKGPDVFAGYWNNDTATAEALGADGWLHTGDIGALDEQGFLRVTGRQKELIVTAGGTNVAPAILEDRIRAHPLVSQAAVLGDGRPFIACLVTLDPDALAFWKQQHRRPADATARDLADDPVLVAEIQRAVDQANQAVSRAESVRRFRIVPMDFTEASGQLTPTDKVRRNVVLEDFAADIEALYARTG
jgi:long-chain acyl-CoA synthetase